jgi:uncharacterized protein (TIGR00251 family)
MRIYLKVIPKSSQSKIEKIAENEYKAWVTVVPEKGKANMAVIKLLSKYFKVSKSQIDIVGGKTARIKIVDIIKNN